MQDVKERANELQRKYNLSNEQIEQIKNVLYCICENIIGNYINNKTNNINKPN